MCLWGAGCSSSTALVVASSLAGEGVQSILRITEAKGRARRLLQGCEECEWEFSGVKGGCMDHLAIVYGRGCVVSLDCRDEKVDAGLLAAHISTDAAFVLLDTQVKHDLGEFAIYRS